MMKSPWVQKRRIHHEGAETRRKKKTQIKQIAQIQKLNIQFQWEICGSNSSVFLRVSVPPW